MKNKIYFTHILNDYSGSPRVLRDVIEEIKDCNAEINILTNKNIGFLTDISNVNYIYINYLFKKNKLIQILFFIFVQIEIFFKLSYVLIKNRLSGFNCTVVNNTVLPFGGGIAGYLFANNNLYYIHESYTRPKILKKFLLYVINVTANKVIFVSKYLKDELNINKESIVIYNVLRSDFDKKDKIDFFIKYKYKEVFFASSLKDYKGIYNLLKIAKKTTAVNFVVALNCDEIEFNIFNKECSKYHNIQLHHRPDNIEELYLRSFVILNLTIPELCVETFGLSILEGISYGCVPIVPPVGGPLELVNDDFGYKISSNNIDKISLVISELANDYDIWLEKAKRAECFSKCFERKIFKDSIMSTLEIK